MKAGVRASDDCKSGKRGRQEANDPVFVVVMRRPSKLQQKMLQQKVLQQSASTEVRTPSAETSSQRAGRAVEDEEESRSIELTTSESASLTASRQRRNMRSVGPGEVQREGIDTAPAQREHHATVQRVVVEVAGGCWGRRRPSCQT
mmetsp:Transcript_9021/g.27688  ORF Transcript_9021/g.27688 Transcript_9021/m.27688 type:complete len:146 (+) Transcript_9021:257-694(+)